METKSAGDPFCELSVEECAPERSAPVTKGGKWPAWESHFSFFVGGVGGAFHHVIVVRQNTSS
jgi:hypothetical protein